ncbi:MAG: preprotein translocase subunit YajC [Duncaniella sp.]|nr:preprotein translocase subunit YajC [Duncaniella sp.]MDE6118164.1 preprotein translocase subunit YajC [Duncaniella sp.]MDE6859332.1 preprotein translocase subunit YajC [Duncaniella sp.]
MLNTILLQAQGAAWTNILMIVALIAIFYLFMIRPQQKRQKEIRKFREGLKPGDSVVTAGGIYGKIRAVNENTFSVEITQGVRITIDKGSVYPSAQQATEDAAQAQK